MVLGSRHTGIFWLLTSDTAVFSVLPIFIEKVNKFIHMAFSKISPPMISILMRKRSPKSVTFLLGLGPFVRVPISVGYTVCILLTNTEHVHTEWIMFLMEVFNMIILVPGNTSGAV